MLSWLDLQHKQQYIGHKWLAVEAELQTNDQIALVIDLLQDLLIKPIRAIEEQHKQNVDYINVEMNSLKDY